MVGMGGKGVKEQALLRAHDTSAGRTEQKSRNFLTDRGPSKFTPGHVAHS